MAVVVQELQAVVVQVLVVVALVGVLVLMAEELEIMALAVLAAQ